MSYKHILVTVDLSVESRLLLEKAVSLTRDLDAKLSLFYDGELCHEEYTYTAFDPRYAMPNKMYEDHTSEKHLKELLDSAQFPIQSTFVGSGHLIEEIERAIKELNVDLVVCGHHHSFWHQFSSSAKQLLKSTSVDLLVVPLK